MKTSRWLTLFGGALAVLLLVAHIIPVRDYYIELQPDGKNLGTVPAEGIRIVGIAFASIPLATLAAIIFFFAQHSRLKVNRGLCVGSALMAALLMLAYALHTMRN